ncbi:MAG: class I SAM-dependent methyltransferase [Gracilimonas sp.]
MKKHRHKPIVQITAEEIEQYALAMTTEESHQVQELVASSAAKLDYIDMLSGNLVGQLLRLLIKVSGAKRVLEIGTFTGYSALMMAEALPEDGEITTIEMNIRYQELAEQHFDEFDSNGKISLIKGNAREIVGELDEYFDLVYLDGDKISYPFYFEQYVNKLKEGGLMVIDNALWNGTVLEPEDQKAEALHRFNKQVADDDRVEQVLLAVSDGVTIIRKK